MLRMFGRMSWESPPFEGPNPLEHVHGPDCNCSPESALRVQYLRLLHNFVDRDFHNNPMPDEFLSPVERQQVKALGLGVSLRERERGKGSYINHPFTGLLSRVTYVLVREPLDSIYRFWLSSCLEAFMRGSGPAERSFLAEQGVGWSEEDEETEGERLLDHLVEHITASQSATCSGNVSVSSLQTSFDLLGELVKYNPVSMLGSVDCAVA